MRRTSLRRVRAEGESAEVRGGGVKEHNKEEHTGKNGDTLAAQFLLHNRSSEQDNVEGGH